MPMPNRTMTTSSSTWTATLSTDDENRSDSQVRILVDEGGNVVDMHTGDAEVGLGHGDVPESPVTATEPVTIITATTEAARPPSKPSPTFPVSTMVSEMRMGSVVMLAPF